MPNTKSPDKTSHPHPHIGNMIHQFLKQNGISNAALARKLNISSSNIKIYLEKNTLQFSTLWNISIALDYDFLGEIMNNYPDEIRLNPNGMLLKELNENKSEVTDLQKEIKIYRSALGIKD